MVNFKQITDTLVEHYNNAVGYYHNGDFSNFFIQLRLSTEGICKAIIFDALQDNEISNKILEGKKKLDFNTTNNKYEIKDGYKSLPPQNSTLLYPAEHSLYYKSPDILDDKKNNVNRNLNNEFRKLGCIFSDASSLGSHSDETSYDPTETARSAATTITAFFDFFKQKGYLTSELQNIFDNSLKKISIEAPSQKTQETEEELKDILEKTYSFGVEEGGYRYIIILPAKNPGLKSDELEALFKLPCAIIIDFGTHDNDDIIASISPNSKKNKIRIVNQKEDCTSGKNMVNWFFALGNKERGDEVISIYKEWIIKRYKILSEVLKGILEKDSTNKYFIMDFIEEGKYSKYLFAHLNAIFVDEETVKNRIKIFSFSQNSEVRRVLKEWKEEECNYNFTLESHITLSDFLRFVNEKVPTKEPSSFPSLPTLNFSEEELGVYNEAGINIFVPKSVSSESEVGDFYAGSEITWKELELDYDIKRSKYDTFKNKIINLIRNSTKNTLEYKLRHNPGAGATTMVRRLAYDLYKQCDAEGNDFSCITIFLNDYNNNTIQYLKKLSEEMDNRFIVAVIDSGNISEDNFVTLNNNMCKHKRKVLFIRLFRTGQKEINGGDNTTTLPSKLSDEEIELFYTKYKNQALVKGVNTFPASTSGLRADLEVVDFPLLLNNGMTKGPLLDNYAEEYINKSNFTEELKTFCGFVAFTNYYAEKPLNQNLVDELYKGIVASSNNKEIRNALEKVLLRTKDENGRPDGYWRPRFSAFCEPILKAVWGYNWKSKLPNISKEFIDKCSSMGSALGKKDTDMLHAIFILRNFKNLSDESKTKFSKLIEDVLNGGFLPDSIYKRLIETYPNDTAYMGHFGRFLFEKASSEKDTKSDDAKYDEAEKYIRRAIETSPEIADNYHILGMLYRRKIQTLRKELSTLKNDKDFDSDEIEIRMLSWVDEAKYGFEKSQSLNPASPYGYTTICKLYKECIEFAKKLKGTEDFSFCDKEEKYMEISEQLNNSLSQLGNICQAYEDSAEYMTQSKETYEKIKKFQYEVMGQASEAVERYRNLYKQTGDKQKKAFYGKQQIEAMLYKRTEGLINEKRYYKAFAMEKLKAKDRNEIDEILKYLRRQGDVNCYENIFWFKMSSNEEFSFDDAIDLLQEWLYLCKDDDKRQSGLLKATFYLAVCYSAMAINSEKLCNEYVDQAKKYFEIATKLADRFEISSINNLAFLGEEADVHCILLPSQKKDERKKVKAMIEKIDGRKGYAIIPSCGPKLEAFFSNNDNKYDKLRDERKTYITGSIGFRYDGLRIYDSYTETDLTPEEMAETIKEDYEETENVTPDNNKEQEVHVSRSETTESVKTDAKTTLPSSNIKVKVLGKLDLEEFQTSKSREVKQSYNDSIGKNGTYIGTIDADRRYVHVGTQRFQIDNKEGFKRDLSPKEYDYGEDEEVYFEKKKGPNYKTGGIFTYAINVRPKADEDDVI